MPNPLLARIPPALMPPDLAAAHARELAARDDATFIEVGANAPGMMTWYKESFYATVFYGGRVDVRSKELLRYRLSMTHGCAFCNKGNSKAALRSGVTDAQLQHIMNEHHAVFGARDRAVLQLASNMAMTNLHGALERPLYAALRAHFDDGQIFELGMVGGILTGMAKFIFAYDLVEREATCPIHLPA